MAEQKQYTVYKFDELSKESQAKALERYRDFNVDYDWWDVFPDMIAEDLKEYGLEYISLSFSGFYSQGDGASIEYSVCDKFKFIRHLLGADRPKFEKLLSRIEKWCPDAIDCDSKTLEKRGYSSYQQYYAIGFTESYRNTQKRISSLIHKINQASEAFHEDLCSDLYEDLENEYDYQTSDDAVADALTANEYLFTEDGRID